MKKPLSVLVAALAAGAIFTSSVSPASASFIIECPGSPSQRFDLKVIKKSIIH